jgi:hypothetical protein
VASGERAYGPPMLASSRPRRYALAKRDAGDQNRSDVLVILRTEAQRVGGRGLRRNDFVTDGRARGQYQTRVVSIDS